MKEFFIKILEWIGQSPFRLFAVIALTLVFGSGWFFYTEKDAFMASYRAQQALPKMNGKYEEATNFLLKNTNVELIAIFEVNQLLNTRKLVYMTSRSSGRTKQYDGTDVGLLTKNYDNNNDVIGLISGKIPCSDYPKAQSYIGFVYREMGVNYMCRISVPAEPGLFVGQISIGFKETPEDLEQVRAILLVASGMLFKNK